MQCIAVMIRSGLKWTGCVVCILLLAAWFLSYTDVTVGHFYSTGGICFVDGRVCQTLNGRTTGHSGWQLLHTSVLPATDDISVPVWLPLLLVAVPTMVLWRRALPRYPKGRCPGCGYDLTGSSSGRCPECGRTISAKAD